VLQQCEPYNIICILFGAHTAIDILIFGFVNRAGPKLTFDEMYCAVYIVNYSKRIYIYIGGGIV